MYRLLEVQGILKILLTTAWRKSINVYVHQVRF